MGAWAMVYREDGVAACPRALAWEDLLVVSVAASVVDTEVVDSVED